MANLREAFPDWDEARLRATARGVYRHFGAVLLDLLWMEGRSAQELLALADVEGVEHMVRARAAGRGVVAPSGHFGNWEFQAIASVPLAGNVAAIARPLDNPLLDRRLVALRTGTGNTVIYKQRALVQVLKAIRDGGIVAVLIDQNVQQEYGVFVDFFGRPACTTTVAAALALKTGCAIVPVRCVLQPNGRYRMVYGPAVDWTGTGRRDAGPRRADAAPDVDHRVLGAREPRAVALAAPALEDPAAVGQASPRAATCRDGHAGPSRARRPLVTPERLLVRAPNWIGDVVLSLPALRDLRRAFPAARLSVLARPWVAELYRAVPEVDEIVPSQRASRRRAGTCAAASTRPSCSRTPSPRPSWCGSRASPSAGATRPTAARCC